MKTWMCAAGLAALLTGSVSLASGPAAAQTVMQQCGQQYQAAKSAGSLNGQTWNQYRTECAARLKAQPASVTTTETPAPPAAAAANPLKPAPAVATAPAPAPTPAVVPATPASTMAAAPAGKQMSPGRVAFVARERQCGTEWKANKATLTVQTPGLTWPKYLSQCNTRLKAAGQ